MSAAKWLPTNDDLDTLARSMPPPRRDADRIEQDRTSILAQAARVTQHKRASRFPVVAAVATTIAAAAAVLIWFVGRPTDATTPKETITAIGPARFERTAAWPDFIVRIDEGRVAIHVSRLDASERFRATTSDAEIEVRGAKLVVGTEHQRVTFVSVSEGRAELRWAQQPIVVVAAGTTWLPPRIAERETIELAPPGLTRPTQPVSQPETATQTAAMAPKANVPRASMKARAASEPDKSDSKADPQPTTTKATSGVATESVARSPTEIAPRPGEVDFRAGVAALRAGDAAAAARLFSTACAAAQNDALGEDACFWAGAAAKRAGQTAAARQTLTQFLVTYPRSARAGEAAALLGWLLYDAGDLDAAQRHFELAARDAVPKVKESAAKGLEAVKRRR